MEVNCIYYIESNDRAIVINKIQLSMIIMNNCNYECKDAIIKILQQRGVFTTK